MFGDCMRRVRRNPYDLDAKVLGGGEVDIVDSGAAKRYGADPVSMKSIQYLTVRLVVDEDADGVEPLGERRGVGRELGLMKNEFMPGEIGRFKILFIVTLSAEKGDFHKGRLIKVEADVEG